MDHKIVKYSIVIIFGIILGYFICKTYFIYTQHLYPIRFKETSWITTVGESSQAYFRKEIYLVENTKKAWLKISAKDSYAIYINGKLISKMKYTLKNESAIYDINYLLKSGKNIIAISVHKMTLPKLTKLALEGAYTDKNGYEHSFFSDKSWRVAPYEERQGNGDIVWYAEEFNDKMWNTVKILGKPNEFYFLDIHPDIISEHLHGNIVWHPDSQTQSTIFSKELTIPKNFSETWVRIVTDGNFNLYVNDITIAQKISFRKNIYCYNITPYIHKGLNHLIVEVEKQPHIPGFFLDGFIISDGKKINFQTDHSWKATNLTFTHNNSDKLTSYPVTLLSYIDEFNLRKYKKVYEKINPPEILILKKLIIMAIVILFTILLIFALWMSLSIIFRKLTTITIQESMKILAIAHLPSILFLLFIYLLRYDINFDLSFPFTGKFIFESLVILCFFEIILLLECMIRHKRIKKL